MPALEIEPRAAIDRDIYTLAGIVRYDARSFYMGGGLCGNWGNGTWKDNTVGAVGDFDSNGFIGAGYIGIPQHALGRSRSLSVLEFGD